MLLGLLVRVTNKYLLLFNNLLLNLVISVVLSIFYLVDVIIIIFFNIILNNFDNRGFEYFDLSGF